MISIDALPATATPGIPLPNAALQHETLEAVALFLRNLSEEDWYHVGE